MKKYGDIRANKEKAHAIPLLLNIETHFAVVNDPRQYGKVDHPLINIIFITLCGVLWGTDDWLSFTEFARAQEKWLAKYLT